MKSTFPAILGLACTLGIGFVYAVDSFRVALREDTSDVGVSSSYDSQQLYIQSGALSIINLDSDDSFIGDYFSGYYHDTAYGVFSMEYNDFESGNTQRVRISSDSATGDCETDYFGYKLEGYSFNPDFGAMNFNHDSNNYVFICLPVEENGDALSYLSGSTYSELIGTQYFGWIDFDAFIDRSVDHISEAGFVRVEGVSSSQNENTNNEDFGNDIRLIGNVEKSGLRKDIQQNISIGLRGAKINNGILNIGTANVSDWSGVADGAKLLNDTVLYFGDLKGATVNFGGATDISGIKTIVVEGGDIIINANIIDAPSDNDMLGIISLEKDEQGGNILIDSSVTDIHAILYADKSLLTSHLGLVTDGDTQDSELRNQLYINGSIFSENTTGGAFTAPYICPFYETNTCSLARAKKYDLGFLRRYILVSEVDADGVPTGVQSPLNGGKESEMGDGIAANTGVQSGKAGYNKYPLIIEYNAVIQTTPPPFF